MKALVIVPPISEKLLNDTKLFEYDYLVGIDSAVDTILSAGLKVDLAIGDFDSISSMKVLEGIEYIKLPENKDETDTLYALNYLINERKFDVTILGGIGGARPEHTHANLLLFYQFDNLKILSEDSIIFKLNKGNHFITNQPNNDYNYISIFSMMNDTKVSLKGFKFDLDQKVLNLGDIVGISNELDSYGEIIVHKESVLVFINKKTST